MNNKSVSDFVAATMNAVLNSREHKSLFSGHYKTAAKKEKNSNYADSCMIDDHDHVNDADNCMVDDMEEDDEEMVDICDKDGNVIAKVQRKFCENVLECLPDEVGACLSEESRMMMEKETVSGPKGEMSSSMMLSEDDDMSDDEDMAYLRHSDDEEFETEDGDMASTASFDVAIDGLLTASAALDSINMANSSTVSLKLASLIVEAKKAVKEELKSDKKSKKSKPKNKKLTSADFKKMHEEDDDGKLTSANFKKMLAKKK